MRTIGKILGVGLLGLMLTGCSSTVKVADSWKDVKTTEIKNKNILVVSKTANEIARVRFEKDLVTSLNKKGYNAVESFVKFPNIKPSNKVKEGEIKEIISDLKKNGVDVVLMTVLRDVKEFTKETTTSNSMVINTSPMFYRRGFYRGFRNYYSTIYVDTAPTTTKTIKGKEYILETVVYDLNNTEEKELISVITTQIDNPETLGTTSEEFAKKIAKELSKK